MGFFPSENEGQLPGKLAPTTHMGCFEWLGYPYLQGNPAKLFRALIVLPWDLFLSFLRFALSDTTIVDRMRLWAAEWQGCAQTAM